MQRRAMENLSSRTAPIQVSEAEGMESVIVEAIAFEVASGVKRPNRTIKEFHKDPLLSPFPPPLSICLQQSMRKRFNAILQQN
jgi:hypothetical protein